MRRALEQFAKLVPGIASALAEACHGCTLANCGNSKGSHCGGCDCCKPSKGAC